MSDIRYMILPPSFLSKSLEEAGFCLWLLHPEPSSRPSSRDILKADLISEDKVFSSIDQSSASIDEEDAEADLLLHFLLNLKEQREKQAGKLAADVECLETDIQDVDRYSRACSMQTNFNHFSDNYPLKLPINMEGASRFSDSNINKERLMRNIDQLENAYFSLRSKVELPQTTTAERFDTDIPKIRDKCSRVQNDDDVCNKSTDPLGTFFGGLCKYARYNKFEVCGSLRSVDIVNSPNVICSLSFDRDEDYFATAGVSKKIKIFEFGAVLKDCVDIHYPLIEMSSQSKLSCVCWNSYIKNYLASTDYEGVVQARPTVYQVVKDMIDKMGYQVKLVRVTKRVHGAYFAQFYLTKVGNEEECISFDLRPSDAINMAVRCKVPIQVNKHLAYSDGMKVLEPSKLALQSPFSDGLLFTELDRCCQLPLALFKSPSFCWIKTF